MKCIFYLGLNEIGRQPTKKFRYIGDFKENDMDSPTKARKFLKIASNVVEKKDMQLKDLRKKNKKLEKRVASLEQILDEIKKKNLVSDAASNILQVNHFVSLFDYQKNVHTFKLYQA